MLHVPQTSKCITTALNVIWSLDMCTLTRNNEKKSKKERGEKEKEKNNNDCFTSATPPRCILLLPPLFTGNRIFLLFTPLLISFGVYRHPQGCSFFPSENSQPIL